MLEKFIPMQYHIRQSNLIEGVDDESEDRRSYRAWRWLIRQEVITESVILDLHRRIMVRQLPKYQRGYFRTVNVRVGNHIAPSPEVARGDIHSWAVNMQQNDITEIDPIEMHIEFERIHPFIDGNGRTGRMLMWWHQIKKQEAPTLIDSDERQDYYAWFRKNEVE